MHPALLDAALHAVARGRRGTELALPFSWQQVALHAAGAAAVRVRIAPTGPNAVTIELADGLGLPVLSVARWWPARSPPTNSPHGRSQRARASCSRSSGRRSPRPRPCDRPPTPSSVFESDAAWQPIPSTWRADVHAATHHALERVQTWLAEPSGAMLVVVTRGAVALPGEDVTDLAGAAVWGLVRAAQTENPGRIVLAARHHHATSTSRRSLARRRTAGRDPRRRGAHRRVVRSRGSTRMLTPPASGKPWRLGITEAGTFDNLALEPVPNSGQPLAPGHMRVEIKASAPTSAT